MTGETPKERRKRVDAIFENVGEAAVQIAVLDRATTRLFPGISKSEPQRDEAEDWLRRKARQKRRLRAMMHVGWASALVAAVASVGGLF